MGEQAVASARRRCPRALAQSQGDSLRACHGRRNGAASELPPYGAWQRTQRKGPPQPSSPPLIQEFHHSQIGSAGITHGGVTQNVTINPAVADAVAALLQIQQIADANPETSAVATLAREAQRELQSNGWSAKAGGLLLGLGGLVQTAAALKPAYQTLQQLAVAHGVALPPWP